MDETREERLSRFASDARRALDNFRVTGRAEGMVEAEASTGFRYVVHRVPTRHDDWLMVVRWPWKTMGEVGEQTHLTPDRLTRVFGPEPGAPMLDHHGGDVYALLACFRELIGITFPEPEALR